MGISWTPEQQQVIDLRKRNILVSAAAGSGKTAVLVERIKERIMDEQGPVDIDEMLVVTFTKAAASQMRERVGAAIERELMEHPSNLRLQKQLALVHNAQITTIDSFCLYVIRNHFHEIDLEPSFRIADEGELKLLEQDVLEQLLEAEYQKQSEEFLRLADIYATGKSDEGLKSLILQLSTFAQSYPWPKEWLCDCLKSYRVETTQALKESPVFLDLMSYAKQIATGVKEKIQQCLILCNESDGPGMYCKALESDLQQMAELEQCVELESPPHIRSAELESPPHVRSAECDTFYAKIQTLEFARLASVRGYDGDLSKQEYVKSAREAWKKTIGTMRDKYFSITIEQCFEQMKKIEPVAAALVDLTIRFIETFADKKRDRNIVDFGDLEHFALQILVDGETKQPTGTAREFQQAYAEIMIDEYQDSNYVQESILRAISRESRGENNIFMVGDVKQSIYRFRLARPELFMEKYDTYTLESGDCQRVDLHKNFRSRNEILDFANDIFYKIMHRNLGNVEYDEAAALYPGASYPDTSDLGAMFEPEILLSDSEDEQLLELEAGDLDKVTLEAMMIADKIKQMMEHQFVTDEQTGQLRNMEYGDVVILLRSLSGYADIFTKVLMEAGIPAHTTSKTGYFSALEVQVVLNYLRLLDNPLQDIPLAAVLKSPIGGFGDEDLAKIRIAAAEFSFSEAFFYCVRERLLEDTLREKADRFLKTFEALREMAADKPIHELILEVLEQTGYGDIAAALPGGVKRQANLMMLIEKAIAYEGSSYHGLFHFIRYIDELQKYDVDFGEADMVGEMDRAVRIMSIHKSKGLEFPIVFVSGLGKQFNKQDTRSRMILHPRLGIGLDEIDTERHLKIHSITKQMIANQGELENLGEELRILYVALTRPQEKLILTGVTAEVQKKLERFKLAYGNGGKTGFMDVAGAKNYLELVLMAVSSYDEKYKIQVVTAADLILTEVMRQGGEKQLQEEIGWDEMAVPEETAEFIEERLSYRYPYERSVNLQMKYSVSELKHRAMRKKFEEEDSDLVLTFPEKPVIPYIPPFISSEAEEINQGALHGTAVHRVLECLDFAVLPDEHLAEEVRAQMKEMLEKQRMTEEMAELVNVEALVKFLHSPIALRMRAASKQKKLYKEKPFVLGIQEEELILVQGIIDVFWLEEDRIVLLDYKTDRVNTKNQLAEMYQEQLDLYAKALQAVWNKPVEGKYIYSFSLSETIMLP